jgi:hypothetical protein
MVIVRVLILNPRNEFKVRGDALHEGGRDPPPEIVRFTILYHLALNYSMDSQTCEISPRPISQPFQFHEK